VVQFEIESIWGGSNPTFVKITERYVWNEKSIKDNICWNGKSFLKSLKCKVSRIRSDPGENRVTDQKKVFWRLSHPQGAHAQHSHFDYLWAHFANLAKLFKIYLILNRKSIKDFLFGAVNRKSIKDFRFGDAKLQMHELCVKGAYVWNLKGVPSPSGVTYSHIKYIKKKKTFWPSFVPEVGQSEISKKCQKQNPRGQKSATMT